MKAEASSTIKFCYQLLKNKQKNTGTVLNHDDHPYLHPQVLIPAPTNSSAKDIIFIGKFGYQYLRQ
jgi:hypothetical protein